MSITTYKNYFRNLAVLHKKLRHDPSSELPEAPRGGCHFTFFSQDDVVTNKLRSQIGDSACLHLHMYDWGITDTRAFSPRGNYDCGFIVSQKAALNNLQEMEAAYSNTETIVEDLIAHIMLDYSATPLHCSNALGSPDFNSIQVAPVGPLWDNRFGWFVTFPFSTNRPGTPDELKAIVDAAFISSERIFEEQFETTLE